MQPQLELTQVPKSLAPASGAWAGTVLLIISTLAIAWLFPVLAFIPGLAAVTVGLIGYRRAKHGAYLAAVGCGVMVVAFSLILDLGFLPSQQVPISTSVGSHS